MSFDACGPIGVSVCDSYGSIMLWTVVEEEILAVAVDGG